MPDEYTTWKSSQAKPWAKMVQRAAVRLKALEEEIANYDDGVRGVRYDRDGGGSSMANGDDAMAALAMQRDELRRKAMFDASEWRETVSDFQDALYRMDGTYDALLRYRYIVGMEWEEIAGKMGYSCDYCRGELQVNALGSLYDVMPHRYRDPVVTAT